MCKINPRLWYIIQITGNGWWQVDFFRIVHIKIFAWNEKGLVRLVESYRKEKWFVMIQSQLIHRPVCNLPIRHIVIINIQRSPVKCIPFHAGAIDKGKSPVHG